MNDSSSSINFSVLFDLKSIVLDEVEMMSIIFFEGIDILICF